MDLDRRLAAAVAVPAETPAAMLSPLLLLPPLPAITPVAVVTAPLLLPPPLVVVTLTPSSAVPLIVAAAVVPLIVVLAVPVPARTVLADCGYETHTFSRYGCRRC